MTFACILLLYISVICQGYRVDFEAQAEMFSADGLCPLFSLLFFQEPIDIFEGVRDDQALCMATNLGFKGPLQRQVMCAFKASKYQSKKEVEIHPMHI